MPNPTGKNQYSGGKGGKKKSLSSRAKSMGAAQRSRSVGKVSLASGTSSAAHDAFIRAGLAKKAAKKKKRR